MPSGGCRVGFSPELVAWWARGSVHAGWAVAGYLPANGCRVRSTRRFLCWTLKKKNKKYIPFLPRAMFGSGCLFFEVISLKKYIPNLFLAQTLPHIFTPLPNLILLFQNTSRKKPSLLLLHSRPPHPSSPPPGLLCHCRPHILLLCHRRPYRLLLHSIDSPQFSKLTSLHSFALVSPLFFSTQSTLDSIILDMSLLI
ncbi:hypothetical protein Hanom_Chr04g00356641 [Helianthus anomalus]